MEIWTVVPAPNLYTLAPAVAVPELTPWAIICCLAAGAIATLAARGWARIAGTIGAALALGFALVPWCLLPSTIATADREMRAGLGEVPPSVVPAAALSRPYDLLTALRGYGDTGALRIRRDLPVMTRDGKRLGLDLYEPARTGPHPAVIVIYGGAWIFGSRAESAELARTFAHLGYTAVAIDYRHAPAYRFPTQLDDVRDALATIARNAAGWGIDGSRVAIYGSSAGAELALLAAYEPTPLTIRAAIGFYAPTDLIGGYRRPPRPDPAHVRRILDAYLGGPPEAWPGNYLASSPISAVRSGLPPTLLVIGGRDELVRPEFAFAMRDQLRRDGNRAVTLVMPWSNHAFDAVSNGTGSQIARYYTERFIAATL